MNYNGIEVSLILQGNEVDVIDYLLLGKTHLYSKETVNCLLNLRDQITDVLQKEFNKVK